MATTAADIARYGLYIGGDDVDAASGDTFDALNPTTGRVWATHARAAEGVGAAARVRSS